MITYVIFTIEGCPFCTKAIQLMQLRNADTYKENVKFVEAKVDRDQKLKAGNIISDLASIDKNVRITWPQILYCDDNNVEILINIVLKDATSSNPVVGYIGGCDDLSKHINTNKI